MTVTHLTWRLTAAVTASQCQTENTAHLTSKSGEPLDFTESEKAPRNQGKPYTEKSTAPEAKGP